MSNVGFLAPRGSSAAPDKVDMSLDDIIRLNKKEQQQARRPGNGNRRPLEKGKGFLQGKPGGARVRAQAQRGVGGARWKVTRVGVGRGRKIPPLLGRRRGQGVITGLAARKTAALQKGISPLNRSSLNQKARPFNSQSRPFSSQSRPFSSQSQPFSSQSRPFNSQSRPFSSQSRPFNSQSQPFIQPAQFRQKRPYRQTDVQRGPNFMTRTRPFQLRRRPLPPVHQTQRDARQATFLFHRGLKDLVKSHLMYAVREEVEVLKEQIKELFVRKSMLERENAVLKSLANTEQLSQLSVTHVYINKGPPMWRTSTNSSGILTVSIDNPTAMTQPEPASTWSLHPSAPPATEPVKMEVETKPNPPKGVPLQFDINSVGKQTAMTLNDRFRILKDKRVATAQTSKGSRFVTVG